MSNAPLAQQFAQFLTGVDGDGTHQHRLSLGMGFFHRLHNGFQLLRPGLVYRILPVYTGNGPVSGHFHHIHTVDVPELILFGQRRTGTSAFFVKKIKEILESNGCQGLALPLYLNPLLGLDSLVQAVGIAPSRHDAPGKFIHDQHLIVLNHIVLVPEHQVVSPQRQNDIVLDLQILRIGIVVDMEKFLHLFNACRRQIDYLVLLVDDKISRFLLDNPHQGIHLGELLHIIAPLHLPGQHVAHLIQGGGLAALAGNDQRRPGLVDQHRVHLVDNGKMEIPQHQLLLVDHHIIPQIIKSQLIVGHIGDIAAVRFLPLFRGHAVEHHAHGEPQELMNLSHPLRITLGQIVVDGNHAYPFSLQGI